MLDVKKRYAVVFMGAIELPAGARRDRQWSLQENNYKLYFLQRWRNK